MKKKKSKIITTPTKNKMINKRRMKNKICNFPACYTRD